MRKTFIVLCLLLLSAPLSAQERTGNIYGRVVDSDGNPLPGVSVTLTGRYTAPQAAVTTAEGNFRFLSLPVANDYAVRLELSGFRTRIDENIVINIGTNANLTLTMEVASIEEEVTVTAVTPVVDTKKTAVGQNVTQELLQGLPTARDPWVILQMAPSVVIDRENVGGAESGQQSTYVGRGATSYGNNVWTMDGVLITDTAAIGSSPGYWDFDAFEEMQITVGGADVTVQTGGIAMNMVTRRGGNKMTFGGRFYYSDENMQATYSPEKLAELGIVGYNKIRKSKDFGFNLGVPIVKDKAWFWGSYGVQDIGTFTVYGNKDDTLLENYVAKVNLQIVPQNRFEAFIHSGNKIKSGRSTSVYNPEGLAQGGRYKYGNPILKLQDEHMFGSDLFMSLKFAFGDSGFQMTPMVNLAFDRPMIIDNTAQRYYGSQASRYYVERPQTNINYMAQYFNDRILGAAHEFKLGVERSQRKQYVESVYAGNFYFYRNYNTPQIDLDANGTADVPDSSWYYWVLNRGYYRNQFVRAFSGFLQDTINIGRLTLMLGLRYDYQTPYVGAMKVAAIDDNGAYNSPADGFVMDSAAKSAVDALLPGLELPDMTATAEGGAKYAWKVLSPRLGLTFDITGNGKTLAKLSFGQYGDFMGAGQADYWMPGGTSGSVRFWWHDANGDKVMTTDEMYWLYRRTSGLIRQPYNVFTGGVFSATAAQIADANGYFWTGYDIYDPLATTDPYTTFQPDASSTRTTEVLFTLEREIFTDFAVQLNATWRKYDRFTRSLKYFPGTTNIDNPDWYISAGRVPAELPGLGSTGEASQHDWYYTSTTGTAASNYYTVERMPNARNNDYWGFDLVLNKRLTNKWMLNGSATYQIQRAHYGDRGEGYFNPTNLWAVDGKESSAYIGGSSGIADQFTNARWMVKLSGLYQFPLDINASFNVHIREGWIIQEGFTFFDYTLPNPASQSTNLYISEFGSKRLPAVLTINAKIEKMLRLGDNGRIYLMADVFNLLNVDTILRRLQNIKGTYYWYGEGHASNLWVPNVNDFKVDGVMNPRVLRLGVRFTF